MGRSTPQSIHSAWPTYVTLRRPTQILLVGGERARAPPPRPRTRPPAALPCPRWLTGLPVLLPSWSAEARARKGSDPPRVRGRFPVMLVLWLSPQTQQWLAGLQKHTPCSAWPTTGHPHSGSLTAEHREMPISRAGLNAHSLRSTPTIPKCQEVDPRGATVRHAGTPPAPASRDLTPAQSWALYLRTLQDSPLPGTPPPLRIRSGSSEPSSHHRVLPLFSALDPSTIRCKGLLSAASTSAIRWSLRRHL